MTGDELGYAWPAGATWVFQGTVAEDATAGTHVCSLTVTPGAGNEMQVLYGSIIVGATATPQTATAVIDDGTNRLMDFFNPVHASAATSGAVYPFPQTVGNSVATNATASNSATGTGPIVSGTMRLVLTVSTTAVSVTQTFAVVCRIYGVPPTATLADTVGTPTLTTNTNQVF